MRLVPYIVDPATNAALLEEGERKAAERRAVRAQRADRRLQAQAQRVGLPGWRPLQPGMPPRFR